MHTTLITLTGFLATNALAQGLDKPPLTDGLSFLQDGLLDHLHPVHSSHTKWGPGYIPIDCKTLTEQNNLSAADMEIYSVQYDDCPHDPWVMCRHKNSTDPVGNMIDLFGRVPVKARQWVRYLIYLPDPNMTWAYNSGGNIAMFGRVDGDLTVFIHETGHSLDFLGAYPDKPLSNSTKWLAQYSKDSHVPDSYAQTNQLEDVAQNTVVANYDLNVPGGFRAIEGNWSGISHQFHTIEVEQKKASGLLEPGGVCGKRLENSQTVPVVGSSRVMARGLGGPPDSKLSDSVDVIEPAEFDTREDCKGGF